jgi:choline-sulfatase
MTSYFDALAGRLLKALDRIRATGQTVVFVTADHGEMLGERGSWFKFQPFEWSVRVPLITAGPGVKRGHREEKAVSLLDLLPTFSDIATDGKGWAPVDPLDGASLCDMLSGDNTRRADTTRIEFLGEGVYAPACILVRDGMKYVYCRNDPPMLFDLRSDPDEKVNLAGRPERADVEASLHAELHARWDYASVERSVLESQKRRLFAQQALLEGKWNPWDFQPQADASRQYVRGAVDPNTTATKAKRRFPYVPPVAPDHPRDRPAAVVPSQATQTE